MGLWGFYFLGKVYLYYRGYILFSFLLNLLFALLLMIPLSRALPAKRLIKVLRFILALVCAFLLLWHETWFPPLLRTISLLSETGGISPGYIVRFLRDSFNFMEAGILSMILIACIILNRRITLAPLALAAIVSVPLFGAHDTTANIDDYLERFSEAETKKITPFNGQYAGGPDFDVIVLQICSLSWDDLRAVGLDQDRFLRQFDLIFTNFNTVSSYTNPSAIRLLRAGCGQSRHRELYREARNECYLLDALREQGYRTYAAIDNDAPSYRFVEDIIAFGRADRPIEMRDLPVRQYDFDNTPIYDDLSILNRWWDVRNQSSATRAALYMDITTLHGGAHRPDDAEWWKRDKAVIYREFAKGLFENLEAFFRTLSVSGKNFVVIFIPEHGMALRGSSIQSPDIREVPLPSITTVPAAIKIIGEGIAGPLGRQVTVSKPTSYFALSYLLKSFLSAPGFGSENMLTESVIEGIPETRFVSENEASLVVRKDGDLYYSGKERKWIKLPESALK
jgi:cellulose synthase operon protein YhjU